MEDVEPVCVIYLNDGGDVVEISEFFKEEMRLIGIDQAALVGKNMSELIGSVYYPTLYKSNVNMYVDGRAISTRMSYSNKRIFVEINICGGSFVRYISHELNTPMVSNVELLRLLGTTELADNQRTILTKLMENSMVFAKTVNDIMEYMQTSVPVDINAVRKNINTSTVVDKVKKEIGDARPTLFYPRRNYRVNTDEGMLVKILVKVINNSLIQDGVRYVSLRVMNDLRRGMVCFYVVDDGDPISDRQKMMLKTGYVNTSDDDINHKKYSSGIGMVVAKRLSVLLEGDIELEVSGAYGNIYRIDIKN